jgi:iron-sulfur cluster assembly accessory protein
MATVEHETVVSLTEGAATKIRQLMAEEPEGESGVLRIAVQGGGCSGFEYALGFDQAAQEGDHELFSHGIQIVVDPFSAPYLSGTQIDFVDGLQGGFRDQQPERHRRVRLRPLLPGGGRGCGRGVAGGLRLRLLSLSSGRALA